LPETASTFWQAGFDCLDHCIQVIIVTSLFLLTPEGLGTGEFPGSYRLGV
jgi:hypothetical protein